MKCTCQGVSNPECNYDHASENERVDALRYELASLPKFVAEAFQCIDADDVARVFVTVIDNDMRVAARADFGYFVGCHIVRAVNEYMRHRISNWSETRPGDTSDEAAILRTLIARYR